MCIVPGCWHSLMMIQVLIICGFTFDGPSTKKLPLLDDPNQPIKDLFLIECELLLISYEYLLYDTDHVMVPVIIINCH